EHISAVAAHIEAWSELVGRAGNPPPGVDEIEMASTAGSAYGQRWRQWAVPLTKGRERSFTVLAILRINIYVQYRHRRDFTGSNRQVGLRIVAPPASNQFKVRPSVLKTVSC